MIKRTGLVILVALALVTAACGDDNGGLITTTSQTSATTAAQASGERYSAGVRDSYLEGCLEDGNEAACECTMEEFESRYTETEFVRLALDNADAEEIPDEFLGVILACFDQFAPGDGGGSTDAGGTYPDEFRDGYLEGCLADGTPGFCECTLREFELSFSLEDFIGLAAGLEDGAMPDELLPIITTCLSEA